MVELGNYAIHVEVLPQQCMANRVSLEDDGCWCLFFEKFFNDLYERLCVCVCFFSVCLVEIFE